MGLDPFGFPAPALANALLLHQENYGDSLQDLEEAWYDWLHYSPFDTQVADRLQSLYKQRLTRLDRDKDREQYDNLKRKLALTENRGQRYDQQRFQL